MSKHPLHALWHKIVSTDWFRKNSTIDVFRFLDLPAELRYRVYTFAAEACSDLAPLRVRSQR